VEKDELLLMYQPQALHTFEAVMMEALLRWRRPDGSPPPEFIHVAEKTGLIHAPR
jgi:EAL domain-containing protein (putative c-di-GMP-specific phosphodiesterase class I)